MSKIVLNKNFVEKYYHRLYQRFLYWQNDVVNDSYTISTVSCVSGYYRKGKNNAHYADLSTDLTVLEPSYEGGGCGGGKNVSDPLTHRSSLMIVPETFLTLIDRLNADHTIKEFDLNTLYNTFSNNIKEGSSSAAAYLRDNGFLSETEMNEILDNILVFDDITIDNINYSVTNGVATYEYTRPMGSLDNLHPNYSGDLYLLFFGFSNENFDKGSTYTYISSTAGVEALEPKSKLTMEKNNELVEVTPYIAFKLSEKDGTGDLKYDHLDKISHLDQIKFTFSLPKEINIQLF